MMNVVIKRWSAATFVTFQDVQEHTPQYQVRNGSDDHYVYCYQPSPSITGASRAVCIPPAHVVALSWDDPDAPHVIYLSLAACPRDWNSRDGGGGSVPPQVYRAHVQMERIGLKGSVYVLPSLALQSKSGLSYSVGGAVKMHMQQVHYTTTLSGHTRVLQVLPSCSKGGRALRSSAKKAMTSPELLTPARDSRSDVLLRTNFSLGGLGVSMVDGSRTELLYTTLSKVRVSVSTTAESLQIKMKVNKFQMDNQTTHGNRIAVTSPFETYTDDAFLDADLELSRLVTSVRYWRHVRVSIEPLRLQLHEELLWALLQFEHACYSPAAALPMTDRVQGGIRGVRHEAGTCNVLTGLSLEEEAGMLIELGTVQCGRLFGSGMHFEEIRLPKVAVQVTLLGLQAVQWRSQQHEQPDGNFRPIADLYAQVRPMASLTLGVPDVEAHHMLLPEVLYFDWSAAHGGTLATVLWGHYKRTVVMQGLKVLGSSAFWTSLLGDAGDTDKKRAEKMKQRAAARNKGPVGNIREGLGQGIQAAGAGLWEGVTGTITKPWEAAMSGGNIFQGFGLGIAGLVLKPTTGVLNMTNKVTSGFHAGLFGNVRIPRARYPRPTYWDKLLRGYHSAEAVAVNSFARISGEGFVGAVQVMGDHAILGRHLSTCDYLLVSLTRVRVLRDVDQTADDDALEATIVTDMNVKLISTLRLRGAIFDILDANSRVLLTAEVRGPSLEHAASILRRARVALNVTVSVD